MDTSFTKVRLMSQHRYILPFSDQGTLSHKCTVLCSADLVNVIGSMSVAAILEPRRFNRALC